MASLNIHSSQQNAILLIRAVFSGDEPDVSQDGAHVPLHRRQKDHAQLPAGARHQLPSADGRAQLPRQRPCLHRQRALLHPILPGQTRAQVHAVEHECPRRGSWPPHTGEYKDTREKRARGTGEAREKHERNAREARAECARSTSGVREKHERSAREARAEGARSTGEAREKHGRSAREARAMRARSTDVVREKHERSAREARSGLRGNAPLYLDFQLAVTAQNDKAVYRLSIRSSNDKKPLDT